MVEDRQKASKVKQEKCELKMKHSIKKCKSLSEAVLVILNMEEGCLVQAGDNKR